MSHPSLTHRGARFACRTLCRSRCAANTQSPEFSPAPQYAPALGKERFVPDAGVVRASLMALTLLTTVSLGACTTLGGDSDGGDCIVKLRYQNATYEVRSDLRFADRRQAPELGEADELGCDRELLGTTERVFRIGDVDPSVAIGVRGGNGAVYVADTVPLDEIPVGIARRK